MIRQLSLDESVSIGFVEGQPSTCVPAWEMELSRALFVFTRSLLEAAHRITIDITFEDLDEFSGITERHSANHYEILIHESLNLRQAILTLAHECVHVKQFVKRELFLDENKIWWKGTWYPITIYDNEPWEEEALFLESQLFYLYTKAR